MGGGGPEEQARSAITDQGGVSIDSTDNLYVTDSAVEVGDLLSEGVIEGLTSGKYTYEGTKGQTGFYSTGFAPYTASGVALTQDKELGFLRSVYWNDVPVVDINGYYNFSDVNLEYVKGEPAGNLPSLSSKLPANETVDLTVHRAIGERLYGISIQGGTQPTATKTPPNLPNDNKIDAVAKTYTILNKECTSIEVKIKIPALWEQIRNDKAPKKHEVDKTPPPVGYGDTKARSIEYFIYWQPVFDERFDGVKSTAEEIEIEKIKGTWEGPHSEKVTGHISEPYIRTSKINLQSNYTSQYGFDGWRIKIIRVTPESLTAYLKLITYVDSLTEIYGTKLRYPYSCMVYSKFNAEYFTRVPARSYDTKLLKVLIPNNYHPIKKTYGCSDAITMDATTINHVAANGVKVSIADGMKVYFESGVVFTATALIGTGFSGLITNMGTLTGNTKVGETGATVEGNLDTSPATTSTNFWDGGFRYTREWTDNPAWCFYDLLTNSRYGLGNHIDKSQVDKWALYEIAQYCDVLVPDGYGSIEPRFAINHIITSREEAYKVLNDMASIFRGLAYYSNGLIYAVQDAFKKPVYQFNNANVLEGNFTYSSSAKKTRHSVALVRYIDKRNLFQPSVEYVENEEAIKRYGIRQLETTALGCTSRGQARRFGLWMLASEFQETETVAFSVGQDGGYLKPGDILQLYDQNRTPLKFGGRTNAVLNTGVAPSTLTYDNLPVTGNSIIIDNAINFNDKYYKFSLLTPTYYYDTVDIGDNLDSSDINQIRRSQIQDLYFYGPHAQTVTGHYRSDYSQGGSGIATQIYFHTGLLINGVDPIGTGNQLDFENYVITGYTNDYVQGNTEVSYSGDCFSGENLIWSLEPNDPADDEFISGNFSTYRVINVAENDDTSSYNVSALAYSSGKYEDVEGRLVFQSPNTIKAPKWPELVEGGTTVYSAMATVLKEQPNEPVDATFKQTQRLAKYPTIEITFAQAGFDRLGATKAGTSEILPINPDTANPKAIRYLICVKRDSSALGVGFVDTGTSPPVQTFANVFGSDDSMKYLSISASVFKDFYAPHQFKYIDGDTTTDNPYLKGKSTDKDLLNEFLFEFLATSDTSFWVAIFAVNNNMVSKTAFVGLIPGSKASLSDDSPLKGNQIKATDVFSTVGLVTISALTSEDADPSSDTEIVELKTTEPSFSWTMGDERVLYDDLGNRLYIPTPYNNYRITIRENTDTAASFESPIFVELTGYHSPADTANFVFLRDYNDPNMIESLVGNPDASGYKLNQDTKKMEWISDQNQKGTADYFKVETSGVIFKNSPENFPIRDFELVVEAHDSDGATSAGNKVWNNTIGLRATETYATGPSQGWDIFAGTLAVPSGIVFATTRLDTTLIGNNGFLLPQQAYNRNYPYLATAAVYADGTLNLRMEESKAQNGDVILNSNQIRDSFSEVAGLVYYFTTGDSTLQDEVSAKGVVTFNRVNISPTFSIDKNNIPDSIALGNMAIRKKLPAATRKATAVADTGATDAENKAVAWDSSKIYKKGDLVIDASATVDYTWVAIKSVADNGEVNKNREPSATSGNWWKAYWPLLNVSAFRGFALLEGQDPSNFTIPFPAIGDPLVTNIDLSIALFDKLALARYFESDGTTPKRETVTTLDKPTSGQRIPLIFTDKTLNLSRMPAKILDTTDEAGIDDDINWDEDLEFTTPGDSIHLKELSVLSERDSAGSYKSWFDFEIQPETDFIRGNAPADKGIYVGPQYAFTPNVTAFTDPTCDTSGNTTVTCDSTEKMSVGQQVAGSGIPDGTTITVVDNATTFTISQAATSSLPNTTLTFTTVFPTVFLHRGFKSKNIKNITLELSEDYQNKPLSNYWYNPKAPLFKGITDLKIPEFAYLKVEFNEPIDPTKYWLNVDYNQTAGGNEEQKTVEITDSNQKNINSNIRDYIMEESNPEPTCYISEKNENYAKFFIAPFFSRPIAYKDSADAGIGEDTDQYARRFVITVTYRLTTASGNGLYLGTASNNRWPTGNVNTKYNGEKFVYVEYEWFGDETSVPEIELYNNATNVLSGGGANLKIDTWTNLRWYKRRPPAKTGGGWGEDLQLMNLWDDVILKDFSGQGTEPMSKFNKYTSVHSANLKGVRYDIFNPSLSQHTDFKDASNTNGNYYVFNWESFRYRNNPLWTSGGTAEGGYVYHSSTELENYAWKNLMNKGITPNHQTMRVTQNIRIQGGLMISDEYSAPVLP